MKKLLIFSFFTISFAPLVYAQDASKNSEQETGEAAEVTNDLTLEEIIVTGRGAERAKAWRAFAKGDYALAEVEFQTMFEKLRHRYNRLRNASGGSASTSLSNIDIFQISALDQSLFLARSDQDDKQKKDRPLTRQDFGLPLYMAGLSQIKLGKYDAAEKSLNKALAYNRYLYDARFRLALIALEKGNAEDALDQYKILEKADKKCVPRRINCKELNASVAFLSSVLKTEG